MRTPFLGTRWRYLVPLFLCKRVRVSLKNFLATHTPIAHTLDPVAFLAGMSGALGLSLMEDGVFCTSKAAPAVGLMPLLAALPSSFQEYKCFTYPYPPPHCHSSRSSHHTFTTSIQIIGTFCLVVTQRFLSSLPSHTETNDLSFSLSLALRSSPRVLILSSKDNFATADRINTLAIQLESAHEPKQTDHLVQDRTVRPQLRNKQVIARSRQ